MIQLTPLLSSKTRQAVLAFFLCAGGASFFWEARPAHAALPIDGYVGPRIDFLGALASEPGRKRVVAEFGRLSKNVQLDLSYGTNATYNDYGLMLKFFQHWPIGEKFASSGISAGVGIGASYIPDINKSLSDAQGTTTPVNDQKLWDLIVAPYVRALYDTGLGFGVALDLSYEFLPRRTSAQNAPTSDTTMRKRFAFGLGAVIDY